ncbi:MAG: hypothetical protein D6758_06830 [Gammaproteobacteria bacterium]|nr:MAG: hypothetical protein D6758_06830 [Gammaproteobacteria bacterium]
MQEGFRNLTERDRRAPAWVRWAETVLIVAVVLGMCAWIRPEDPFYITGGFPWPLLATVLVALRYGFFTGFMAVVLELLVFVSVTDLQQLALASLPYSWLVGVVAITMLVGEFRDYWQRQIDKLRQSNAYRQIRLDEFTRNYHLLKVSHDRLEMQLAGSGQSLREALRHLQKQLRQSGESGLTPAVARTALDILAEYGSLQRAALLEVREGLLMPEPLAETGGLDEVDVDDDLIHHCMEILAVVSIRPELQGNQLDFSTRYLAAIPLLDAEQHLRGVIVIQLMPFFAFEDKTLRLLAVLAGRIADFIHYHEMVPEAESEEEMLFRANLKRALADRQAHDVPGSLICLEIEPGDEGERLADLVERMRRGLDLVLRQSGHPIRVWVLLPLTDELGMAGYRQRLEDRVKEELGLSLLELPVTVHRHSLSTPEALQQFLEAHGDGG